MDPQAVFCPNLDCPARGQLGKDNIRLHSRKEGRYRCQVCGRTFAARRGTTFYRLRTADETVTRVITLLAYTCTCAQVQVWLPDSGHCAGVWDG